MDLRQPSCRFEDRESEPFTPFNTNGSQAFCEGPHSLLHHVQTASPKYGVDRLAIFNHSVGNLEEACSRPANNGRPIGGIEMDSGPTDNGPINIVEGLTLLPSRKNLGRRPKKKPLEEFLQLRLSKWATGKSRKGLQTRGKKRCRQVTSETRSSFPSNSINDSQFLNWNNLICVGEELNR
ncbi:hypothetical protein Ancab_011773 [Ancistrocladus abbreviatus]